MLLQFIAPGPVDRQNEGCRFHQCHHKTRCCILRIPCTSMGVQEEVDPWEDLAIQVTRTKRHRIQKVSDKNYFCAWKHHLIQAPKYAEKQLKTKCIWTGYEIKNCFHYLNYECMIKDKECICSFDRQTLSINIFNACFKLVFRILYKQIGDMRLYYTHGYIVCS